MPDWLRDALHSSPALSTELIVVRTVLSLLLGFVVAAVYRITLRRRASDTALPTTLVLLCVLIAPVTLVIGDNAARAFGLVGALSIVRFRTVVEDTRDTAYVIFAVVVGMAVGSGYPLLAVECILAVACGTIVMQQFTNPMPIAGTPMVLTLRIGLGQNPETMFANEFTEYLVHSTLTAAATVRQGAAMEFTYTARLKSSADVAAFVAALNRIEGVQGVELKQV